MGEDCGNRTPDLPFDWKLPYLNSLGAPFHLGQPDIGSSFISHSSYMVMTNGTQHCNASFSKSDQRVCRVNESSDWFYCYPRHGQAFIPAMNSISKDKASVALNENFIEHVVPPEGFELGQRRFLVIDQSGDQTTLLYPGTGNPVQYLTSWSRKPQGAYNVNGKDTGTKIAPSRYPKPVLTGDFKETREPDLQSELQEDSEELNALLESDDEEESDECDEVTSTGHSPSTMTSKENQGLYEESTDEVSSSVGRIKKRKKNDGEHDDVPSLKDTASSLKPNTSSGDDRDAESSCGSHRGVTDVNSLPSCKKLRKEKIRETVDILRSIIPGVKDKEAILVLDEAIQYLKSLKSKAMALGLDT